MGQSFVNIKPVNLWPTTVYVSEIRILDMPSMISEIYRLQSTESAVKKSNYGGWQSEVNLFDNPAFAQLTDEIASTVFWLFNKNISIKQMWACVNKHKDFNVIHAHGNEYHLSGVFYLKVPVDSGNICFRDPRPAAINSTTNRIFNQGDSENFIPYETELILFPSFLEHFVMPNESQEDRISVSFDLVFGE